MILNVTVEDKSFPIEIPQEIIDQGGDFFDSIDRDMDRGWQMNREFVEKPDVTQRCQIAADRLVTAMHQQNRKLMLLMGGYIMSRLSGVVGIVVDTTGNIQETRFEFSE